MFPDKRILSFLGLAFGISWTIAGIGLAFGVRAASGIPYTVMAALVMLGPALAAIQGLKSPHIGANPARRFIDEANAKCFTPVGHKR